MKSKKAISPLIATVLVIGFAIVLGALISIWIYQQAPSEEQMKKMKQQQECTQISTELNIGATKYNNGISITVDSRSALTAKALNIKFYKNGEFLCVAHTEEEIHPGELKEYRINSTEFTKTCPGHTITDVTKVEILPILDTEGLVGICDIQITATTISLDKDISGTTNIAPGTAPLEPLTPSCSNGVKDNDETDIDCGGSCPPCPEGKNCTQDSDCASGLVCENGVCTKEEEPPGGGGGGAPPSPPPPPPAECTNGEKRCNPETDRYNLVQYGNAVQECQNGKWVTIEQCAKDEICHPEEFYCLCIGGNKCENNDKEVWTCTTDNINGQNPEGRLVWQLYEKCEGLQVCDISRTPIGCYCKCKDGDYKCAYTRVWNGKTWVYKSTVTRCNTSKIECWDTIESCGERGCTSIYNLTDPESKRYAFCESFKEVDFVGNKWRYSGREEEYVGSEFLMFGSCSNKYTFDVGGDFIIFNYTSPWYGVEGVWIAICSIDENNNLRFLSIPGFCGFTATPRLTNLTKGVPKVCNCRTQGYKFDPLASSREPCHLECPFPYIWECSSSGICDCRKLCPKNKTYWDGECKDLPTHQLPYIDCGRTSALGPSPFCEYDFDKHKCELVKDPKILMLVLLGYDKDPCPNFCYEAVKYCKDKGLDCAKCSDELFDIIPQCIEWLGEDEWNEVIIQAGYPDGTNCIKLPK